MWLPNTSITSLVSFNVTFSICLNDLIEIHLTFISAPVSSFIFIDKTLTRLEYDTWKKKIKSWKTYEQVIAQTYKSGLSYIYLFLDPLVTNDLPNRADQFKSVNRIEIWNTFIKSIFYIGKGTVGNKKGTDTYCRYTKHLTKASVIGPYNKSEKKACGR